MSHMTLSIDSIDETFTVEHASIQEEISRPFEVSIWINSDNHHFDLDAFIGKAASFSFAEGRQQSEGARRYYHGVCVQIEQVRGEQTTLATYAVTMVARLRLLSERHSHRVFQHKSALEIAEALLGDWNVEYQIDADRGDYPALEMRVQYAESDLEIMERVLEREGLSYCFRSDDSTTKVIIDDRLQARDPREGALRHVDSPNQAAEQEFVTGMQFARRMRAGRYRMRGHDFRRGTDYELASEARPESDVDGPFERHHYRSNAMLTGGHGGGDTPSADDRGATRHDESHGGRLAQVGLERHRVDQRVVTFMTNAFDLTAGTVFELSDHPRSDLANKKYLVRRAAIDLGAHSESMSRAEAVFADAPFRPRRRSTTRRINGIESAIVVGPSGEEIYTDEFGRVRVQFHWDREGGRDERSSAWLRVCHGWAGAGFGMIAIPRVGQEVVVGFLGGNPDEPVVIGRLYGAANPPPYRLPENKTVSTWKSQSSPGGGGFNELRFEDKANKELVYLQAQRNLSTLVKANESRVVGGERSTHIKKSDILMVDTFRFCNIKENETLGVGGDQFHEVEGDAVSRVWCDRKRRTELSDFHTVEISQHLVVKANRYLRVDGDAHTIVKSNSNTEVWGDLNVGGFNVRTEAMNDYIVNANKIVLKAREGISLDVGGNHVTVTSASVIVNGTRVLINSGGSPLDGSVSFIAFEAEDVVLDPPEEEEEAQVAAAPDASDVSGEGGAGAMEVVVSDMVTTTDGGEEG